MKRISFVPGAIATPAAITIPADSPDIDAVVSAQIVRLPAGMTIPDHAQVAIVAALADHGGHAHDLLVLAGGGGAPAEAFGASGAGVADLESVTGQTIAGANPATGGITGVGAMAHAAGGAAVAHGAGVGASPVVAAVPTRLTTRTISLDVNTVLGDLLTLSYREVGERVLVS